MKFDLEQWTLPHGGTMKPATATATAATTAVENDGRFIFWPFFLDIQALKIETYAYNQFIHSFHSPEKECENDKNLMF